YVRQLLLVQLWFQPFFDGSSWDGPAWSISAEWLAYLLFGLLVLVIFRMARATRARNLMWMAVAAALPPVVSLLVTGQFYTPWSWSPRCRLGVGVADGRRGGLSVLVRCAPAARCF